MTYLDSVYLKKVLDSNPVLQDFVRQIGDEADKYFSSFQDSPKHISRWAHHYFCKDEGGLLIYDPLSPGAHRCSICGKTYSSELLTGAWYTMYRNHGAINLWKSALSFRVTGERRYLEYVLHFVDFYNDNYLSFTLHNKEGVDSESLDDAPWGTSRIMPQALNESIFLVRVVNALELVKDNLPDGYIQKLREGIFGEAFGLFRPQVNAIHNIPTWLDCGIGVMGLFLDDREMIEFAFEGEFGVKNQLAKGLTADFFWYEGSIHYNNFLLEGVVNLLLFAELYGYSFDEGRDAVSRMIKASYSYAFDNHRFPNPNDGWPDVNLKTYSYVYSTAVKVLGEDSEAGRILGAILNHESERGTLPLSKPYYYNNDISLEEVLFVPELRNRQKEIPRESSANFPSTYCGSIKNDLVNVFLKYGHNGPSHAHPDKMNIEVVLDGEYLSRDLSNAGYGNRLCNEWHRVSASHNTVVVDGRNHSGFDGGECLVHQPGEIVARAPEVYPGISFTRDIQLSENGLSDTFLVESQYDANCDFFFHIDGELSAEPSTIPADLGYMENGYQHLRNIRKVEFSGEVLTLRWNINSKQVQGRIDMTGNELYLMESPDNPVVNHRSTIVLRQKGKNCRFAIQWSLTEIN